MRQPTAERPFHDKAWLRAHLDDERKEANLLAEVREVVFGLQDGVTSILAVVSVVAAASNDTYTVLISGIAATLAEVFSMGAGEYMSSKSQREIFNAQIASERSEVEERPGEAEAEVAFMFEREGLSEASSRRIAAEIAQDPNVLLRTMVEKELGLALEEGGSALQGAAILAGAFFVAALGFRLLLEGDLARTGRIGTEDRASARDRARKLHLRDRIGAQARRDALVDRFALALRCREIVGRARGRPVLWHVVSTSPIAGLQ